MIDGDGANLLHRSRHQFGKFQQPRRAGFLESAPDGIVPIDDARQFGVLLAAESFRTVVAIADFRPEGHIEENSLNVVVADDLLDAGHNIIAIRRVWAEDRKSVV